MNTLLRGPGLYLRELNQLGTPAKLVAYLKASPFTWVAFHANAELHATTEKFATAVKAAGFLTAVYCTPAGITPEHWQKQLDALVSLLKAVDGSCLILDLESPWTAPGASKALTSLVETAARLADLAKAECWVTTYPDHPQRRSMPHDELVGSPQLYNRFNSAKYRAMPFIKQWLKMFPEVCPSLPAWGKTPWQLQKHLQAMPKCRATVYWMADNPGVDDLPRGGLLQAIEKSDPSLRP